MLTLAGALSVESLRRPTIATLAPGTGRPSGSSTRPETTTVAPRARLGDFL